METSINLAAFVVSILWSFFVLAILHLILMEDSDTTRAELVLSSTPIILFLFLLISGNIVLSSIITIFLSHLILFKLEQASLNIPSKKEIEEGDIEVITILHKTEEYIGKYLFPHFMISFAVSFLSGGAILFFGELYVFVLHMLTSIILTLIIFFTLTLKDLNYTNMTSKGENLKWIESNNIVKIKNDDISRIDEKRYRVHIIRENKENKRIWTTEPSKISRELLVKKI